MTLPFKTTICGLAELGLHSGANVTHVLSILDPDYPAPEEFGSYGAHAKLELRFHDVIEDRPPYLPPRPSHVTQLLEFGRLLEREPAGQAHLLVHCHAGVSRSSAALALLLAQADRNLPADAIFAGILAIRPQIWPNLSIVEQGDERLGRNGALVAAAGAIYRQQIAKDPTLAAAFLANGRAREVAAAG